MTACAIPTQNIIDNVDDPPDEISSKGTPVKGIIPVTPPILKKQWTTKYIAVPTSMIFAFSFFILLA